MDIQKSIDRLDVEIEELKTKIDEEHMLCQDITDLEELIDKAIMFGDLCAKRDAKAQVVPEGFVIVSQKDLLELAIAINAVDLATHTESKTNEVREMWQRVALKLMALGTAQEPTND